MTNRETLRSLADKWQAEGERMRERAWRSDLGGGGVYDTATLTLSELCKDFAASLRAIAESLATPPSPSPDMDKDMIDG